MAPLVIVRPQVSLSPADLSAQLLRLDLENSKVGEGGKNERATGNFMEEIQMVASSRQRQPRRVLHCGCRAGSCQISTSIFHCTF